MKINLFLKLQSWIYSSFHYSGLQWFFRNHSNMLIWCSRNVSLLWMFKTAMLLNIFVMHFFSSICVFKSTKRSIHMTFTAWSDWLKASWQQNWETLSKDGWALPSNCHWDKWERTDIFLLVLKTSLISTGYFAKSLRGLTSSMYNPECI